MLPGTGNPAPGGGIGWYTSVGNDNNQYMNTSVYRSRLIDTSGFAAGSGAKTTSIEFWTRRNNAWDTTLVLNGGNVKMPSLPSAPGTKALRIDASGNISYTDTLIDAGGTVTSVATNNGTGITGGTITTTGTLAIDTSLISTRLWRQKGIDSVAGLLSGYVPSSRQLTINGTTYDLSANRSWSVGTVTSVGSGYGLSGGTITSTGTLSVDSATLSNYYLRRKDSLTSTNLLGYVTKTVLADTAAAIRGAAVTGFVPYVGATQDLNLGTHGLRTDNVTFSTSPTATDSTARLVWSNYYGTLGLTYGDGVTINQVGQQLDYTPVTNKTASTIRFGQAVMVDPTNIVQGNRLSIIPMNASGTYPSKLFLGLVTGDIASNGNGYVEWFGDMLNVNSNYVNLNSETWAVGDILYPDPAHNGGLTHTEPIAPQLKLAIAVIKKISGINIDLAVRGSITPDITELNNVNITSPVAGSILAYKASTGAWVDTTIAAAGLAVTSVATNTGTGITGGTITTTGTIAADTLLLSTRAWRQKGIDSVQGNLTAGLATKLNISDTASMLSPYARTNVVNAGLALKVNISDTASMLTPYLRKVDTTAMLSPYKTYYPRTAISLTTTGSSGAATYNNSTGVLNVPQYTDQYTGTVTSVATNTGTGITGGTITTTGTLAIDTLLISTRAWRQKGIDSVASLVTSGYVPTSRTLSINGTSYDLSANRSWSVGTVTSVATNTGTGITGGTITGSGTIAADTLLLSTRAWRQKGIDSVAALISGGGYVTGSGTATRVAFWNGKIGRAHV